MVSPHIKLVSTVPEGNLRSEAKMCFVFLFLSFFFSGNGWGLLVTFLADRMAFVLVCRFAEHLCPWHFCFDWSSYSLMALDQG